MACSTEENSNCTPPPSIHLHMAGLITGKSIHVEGDAGNVHFSGLFDIHQQQEAHQQPQFPGSESSAAPSSANMSILSLARAFTSMKQNGGTDEHFDPSSPLDNTNPNPHPIEFLDIGDQDSDQTTGNFHTPVTGKFDTGHVITRLRSGAITPVAYFRPGRCTYTGEPCDSESENWRRRSKSKRGRSTKGDVLEKVLRRHSLPIRPCNSYAFFIISKWGAMKSSSFQETSKRLGEMWCHLSEREKNKFVEMAMKDSARYKNQCMLLKRKEKGF